VAELMQAANGIGGSHYRYLEPYTMVGIIFLAISLPAAGLIRVFEAWMRKKLGMN
jgi:polar amino acid transport system permease protein